MLVLAAVAALLIARVALSAPGDENDSVFGQSLVPGTYTLILDGRPDSVSTLSRIVVKDDHTVVAPVAPLPLDPKLFMDIQFGIREPPPAADTVSFVNLLFNESTACYEIGKTPVSKSAHSRMAFDLVCVERLVEASESMYALKICFETFCTQAIARLRRAPSPEPDPE
jgi:hypothetical protein